MPLNPALAGVVAALLLAGRADAGAAPLAVLAICVTFLTVLDIAEAVRRRVARDGGSKTAAAH